MLGLCKITIQYQQEKCYWNGTQLLACSFFPTGLGLVLGLAVGGLGFGLGLAFFEEELDSDLDLLT